MTLCLWPSCYVAEALQLSWRVIVTFVKGRQCAEVWQLGGEHSLPACLPACLFAAEILRDVCRWFFFCHCHYISMTEIQTDFHFHFSSFYNRQMHNQLLKHSLLCFHPERQKKTNNHADEQYYSWPRMEEKKWGPLWCLKGVLHNCIKHITVNVFIQTLSNACDSVYILTLICIYLFVFHSCSKWHIQLIGRCIGLIHFACNKTCV